MIVLGVNAPPRGWHDTAACLVIDGAVVAFGEEERFTRRKHAAHQPPRAAVAHCLRAGGIALGDVDVVAVGWDVPALVAQRGGGWRLRARSYARWALGRPLPVGRRPEIVFVPHHLAHATCAFHASPFSRAAVLVVDGIGDDESTSIWAAQTDGTPRCLRRWPPAASLGLLYDAACKAVGLGALDGGKLMGLAAFGRARGVHPWPLADADGDDYRLRVADRVGRHVEPGAAIETVIDAWRATLGMLAAGYGVRAPREMLHHDALAVRTAWSAQRAVELALDSLCVTARRATGMADLCLAGGVALNCAANGRIPDPLYVPPVPHDAGVALGAAWHVSPPRGRRPALQPYLGLDAARADGPRSRLATCGRWRDLDADGIVARLLDGAVGGIVEGRAEAGPRALGHRSIVALPRPRERQDAVNRIKRREPWRPFAPVALDACGGGLWEPRAHLHRYMLGASRVRDAGADVVAAALHVDGTTRPQVLDESDHGVVASVLRALRRHGVAPVLLNTSFNGPGEPIVNSPAHALATCARLGLDFLVVGDRMAVR